MLYKNISDKSQYVVCGSVRQLIASGTVINLSQTDIRHAGSSMRFFESVYKSQEVVDDLFRRSRGVVEKSIIEPVTEEPIVEPVVENIIVKEVFQNIVEDEPVEDEAVEEEEPVTEGF